MNMEQEIIKPLHIFEMAANSQLTVVTQRKID